MFRKINIKTLAGIFFVLLAIVVIVNVYDSKKGERTFKSDLISIDTAQIKSITFFPKTEKKGIKLVKQNNEWSVSTEKKVYAADTKIIEAIQNSLADIRAERVAATDKSLWANFEITDSAGTKVIVEVAGQNPVEFTVGKFTYKQVGQGFVISSYIRLAGENEVYSVQTQLSMFLNRDLNSFRNKTIIKGSADDFTKLTFTFPGDSSYVLSNENNQWKVNGEDADTVKIKSYLNTLANSSGYNFADEKTGIVNTPVYTLKIDGKNMPVLEINAYPSDSINKFIITSSINKDALFISGSARLAERIFEGKSKFVKQK